MYREPQLLENDEIVLGVSVAAFAVADLSKMASAAANTALRRLCSGRVKRLVIAGAL